MTETRTPERAQPEAITAVPASVTEWLGMAGSVGFAARFSSVGCLELYDRAALDLRPVRPATPQHGPRYAWGTTLSSNQGRLRLLPKAARTAGPPRVRPGRWINRAKRTLRPGRSTPPEGV
jgi:hypothetical protein